MYNLKYNMHNFDHYYCSRRLGCNFILCACNNKPANFPVVTDEVRVHCEGPPTVLAALLADSVHRSSYNCCRRPLDVPHRYVYIKGETCVLLPQIAMAN